MQIMLEKNFDSRQFWVKAMDGTKLDCMFFPTTDEKVLTKNELKGDLRDYMKHPTIVICNPNALFY